MHRGNAEKAIPLLERSVAIGPDPRPNLTNNLLPLIRGEREPEADEFFDLTSWGRACE